MTSQLNVDTIVDKAGSGGSNVKMANTSTYVSDGGNVTQNTVQSLAKVWIQFTSAGTFTNNDSFNVTSITDGGAGVGYVVVTNNLSNANHCSLTTPHSLRHAYSVSQATTGTGSVLANDSHVDTDGIHNVAIHGDLA